MASKVPAGGCASAHAPQLVPKLVPGLLDPGNPAAAHVSAFQTFSKHVYSAPDNSWGSHSTRAHIALENSVTRMENFSICAQHPAGRSKDAPKSARPPCYHGDCQALAKDSSQVDMLPGWIGLPSAQQSLYLPVQPSFTGSLDSRTLPSPNTLTKDSSMLIVPLDSGHYLMASQAFPVPSQQEVAVHQGSRGGHCESSPYFSSSSTDKSGKSQSHKRRYNHPDGLPVAGDIITGRGPAANSKIDDNVSGSSNNDGDSFDHVSKKQRLIWSDHLEDRFLRAVHQLGIRKAVPKEILQLMNVEGLTRENVASHLQKHRLRLRKLCGADAHQRVTDEMVEQAQDKLMQQHDERKAAQAQQEQLLSADESAVDMNLVQSALSNIINSLTSGLALTPVLQQQLEHIMSMLAALTALNNGGGTNIYPPLLQSLSSLCYGPQGGLFTPIRGPGGSRCPASCSLAPDLLKAVATILGGSFGLGSWGPVCVPGATDTSPGLPSHLQGPVMPPAPPAQDVLAAALAITHQYLRYGG